MTALSDLRARVLAGSGEDWQLAEYRRRSDTFWGRVARSDPDECWLWTGCCTGKMGYGSFTFGKRGRSAAHRIAFSLHHGRLPRLFVCHSCDNPRCCNPAHLWEGTAADNNRDRSRKGRTVRGARDEGSVRYARGTRHGSAKLSETDVVSIRHDPRPLPQVAASYGIAISTASRIKRREIWRTVP